LFPLLAAGSCKQDHFLTEQSVVGDVYGAGEMDRSDASGDGLRWREIAEGGGDSLHG
jgi:hypothetical protein